MPGETVIVVVGNLTADPELRYTQSGLAVANFTIASTPRVFDKATNGYKDGDALFLRCTAWREFAEQISGSLTKGTRVIAQGVLKMRSYETKEGEKRTSTELDVQEIGPSLRFATAQVMRVQRQSDQHAQPSASDVWPGDQPGGTPAYDADRSASDVWNQPSTYTDETPF